MTRAFNRDCLEAMREFPDNFFDLAVVDPPYGDGNSQNVQVERERERESRRPYNRFGGWWNRYKVEPLRPEVRSIQAPLDGRDGTCQADKPVTHTHTRRDPNRRNLG